MRKKRKRKVFEKVTWGHSGALKFTILVAKTQQKTPHYRVHQPETFLVLIEGEMDKSTIPALREGIAPLFQKNDAMQLIVDLSKVSHVDSAGIATLIDWFHESKRENMRFTLAGPSLEVLTLLELDHLRGVFEVVPPLQWVIV